MKIARFQINADVLLCLGSGKFEVVANPLPEDARVVDVSYERECGTISLFVESETFAPVAELQDAPDLTPPVITRLAR